MTIPHILANGPGNFVDHPTYMDDLLWLYAMGRRNMLVNAGFERWDLATSFANPANGANIVNNWTLDKGGTFASTTNVERSTTCDTGLYSMKLDVTVAGSSDSYVRPRQDIASPSSSFGGLTLVFGAEVKASVADKVRLKISDGVSTSYSAYHTGDGVWQLLTITFAVSTAAASLSVWIDVTSDFVGAVYADSCFFLNIDPSMSQEAISKLSYVPTDDLMNQSSSPVGEIKMFGGATAPIGFLLCNGAAVSRATYSELFTAISTTFGVGDNSTTFNLPDFRGVFPKGAGTTDRAAGKDASGNYYAGTLGTYSTDQMQGHFHPKNSTFSTGGAGSTIHSVTDGTNNNTPESVGSPSTDGVNGTPRVGHTTEPQSVGVTFIIKY